jgi:hypothetical protein
LPYNLAIAEYNLTTDSNHTQTHTITKTIQLI